MKKHMIVVVALALLTPVLACATDLEKYSIKEALSLPYSQALLKEQVKLYFGTQPHGKVAKDYGAVRTMKRTNGVGKTDEEACQRAFVSALVSLQGAAMRRGGNAVIDIKSAFKHNIVVSEDSFQCGAGALMAGMTVEGAIVKIED